MFKKQTRQGMGCGWEPRDPKVPARPWSPSCLEDNHDWRCIGKEQPDPTVCPGFSTSLPETIEIVRAHTHWSTGGGLRDFADEPTEALKFGVEVVHGSVNECQRWAFDHPVRDK